MQYDQYLKADGIAGDSTGATAAERTAVPKMLTADYPGTAEAGTADGEPYVQGGFDGGVIVTDGRDAAASGAENIDGTLTLSSYNGSLHPLTTLDTTLPAGSWGDGSVRSVGGLGDTGVW